MKKKSILIAFSGIILVSLFFNVGEYLTKKYHILTFVWDVKNKKFNKEQSSVIPLFYLPDIPADTLSDYILQTEDMEVTTRIIVSHDIKYLPILTALSQASNAEFVDFCRIGEFWFTSFAKIPLNTVDDFLVEQDLFTRFYLEYKKIGSCLNNEQAIANTASTIGYYCIDEYKLNKKDIFLKSAKCLFDISLDFSPIDNLMATKGLNILENLQ